MSSWPIVFRTISATSKPRSIPATSSARIRTSPARSGNVQSIEHDVRRRNFTENNIDVRFRRVWLSRLRIFAAPSPFLLQYERLQTLRRLVDLGERTRASFFAYTSSTSKNSRMVGARQALKRALQLIGCPRHRSDAGLLAISLTILPMR